MNKLACVLFAVASIGVASAQKVAVINSQKAVLETVEIKKAQTDLETKFKPRQDKIIQIQKDLQTIQSQLQSGKLNAMGEQELNAEGTKKQRDLQRLQQDLQDDVTLERNDILQRSGARMQEVVKKLAEAKGLDIVVDTTNTVFYKPAFDLTAEAVTAYNLAYPVK
jgi:outer membrane protein